MLWDEYVEDITENLRNPRRAREVRRELRDHLLCLKDQFVSEGLAPDEAEKKAMDVLGPVEVLAREFRKLERPYRPLWPIGVTVVGILWAVGSLGVPGGRPGGALLLLAWAVLWGILHLRAFPSLLSRLRSGRPVTAGIDWTRLFPAAWPYLGAGSVFALAFALLVSANMAGLGLFGLLVALAVGAVAFIAADRYPWFADRAPFPHPLSSSLAAVGVLVTLLAIMTVAPATNPMDAFPYGVPGQPVSYGEAVRLAFALAVPVAGLVAALYFSGCTAAHWVADRLAAPAASPQDATLRLEEGNPIQE
ncbi:MAG: permease prefix domain 1-containing protein [Actinomycetia bacterium]|nr:permease prefix domain 1-containing protein [Actinomycetes bacterium]